MRRFIVGLLLTTAALAGGQTLGFSVRSANVTGTYSPDSWLTVVSTMTIRHTGAACSYFITFSAGNSGVFTTRTATNGANSLNYQIYDISNKNVLEDLSANPSSANVLNGHFATGTGTQIQTFTSYFAASQLPVAGTYADSITMNIYIGTVSSHGASVGTRAFSVSTTVPILLDIAIVPTGSPFNVTNVSMTFNFGTLSTGQNLSADLIVRSNYLNTVTATSTNGQVLLNTIPGDTSQIPYTFSFNRVGITLPKATAVKVITSQPATPPSGKRCPMSVTIGTVGFVSAATYSDIITFTATAN